MILKLTKMENLVVNELFIVKLTYVPDDKKFELKQYLDDEGYEYTHVNKDTFNKLEKDNEQMD